MSGKVSRTRFEPVISITNFHTGQVIFNTLEVPNAVKDSNGMGYLSGVRIYDFSKTEPNFILYFLRTNAQLGPAGQYPSMSHEDVLNITGLTFVPQIGRIWVNMDEAKITLVSRGDLLIQGDENKSLWVAAVAMQPIVFPAPNPHIVIDLFLDEPY